MSKWGDRPTNKTTLSIIILKYLKYGFSGDMVICRTSLVISNSENASRSPSDCRITLLITLVLQKSKSRVSSGS
jgi:hypothetical protein